jgi:hypothetical protein
MSLWRKRLSIKSDDLSIKSEDLSIKSWMGLTLEEIDEIIENSIDKVDALIQTMDKLKEKNT